MSTDERALRELIEESEDLQQDALRQARSNADALTDIGQERRHEEARPSPEEIEAFDVGRQALVERLGLGRGAAVGVLGGTLGVVLAGLLTRPASAQQMVDVQALQTASSLEILAVATYGAALTLPFIADGNPVVKAFAETTQKQHDEHRAAFQAQTKALGGVVQEQPNPKYATVVEQAKPMLMAPGDVVTLAAALEQVATETYLADLKLFTDVTARTLTASVMGVESQHLATLRAVGALLAGGAADLIKIPLGPDVAKLPAAAGSVAFPEAFQGTSMASPPEEGAVK